MRISLIVCLIALLGACASELAKQPAPAASTTAASAPGAAAKTPAQSDPEESLEEQVAKAAAAYKKVEKEGQTLYCRKEAMLGSRLPVEHCLTEGELTEQVRSAVALRDRMRVPRGSPCDQLMGCGG